MLRKYLKSGGRNLHGTELEFGVLPGKIADDSFIPAEASRYCMDGYQWLTALPYAESDGKFSL